MKIDAHVQNLKNEHHVILSTNGHAHVLSIESKPTGFGSSVNGAELLCLALATCYCNDIYREASKRGIKVDQVDVEVESEFGADGEPAVGIKYKAKVMAEANEDEIRQLMLDTDRLAEIQNTLRNGLSIQLETIEAVSQLNTSDQLRSIRSELNI